ncbi:hypothetical protein H8959_002114 [Pygathrix nigripes]
METFIPFDLTTENQEMDKEETNTKPRLLKYEEKKYEDIKPLETQPTEIAEKETLEYKTVRTFSESLKSEKTEDYLKENVTQQHMVSPEPASLREKGKSWRKKDQSHACPKVRKASPVSYDRTASVFREILACPRSHDQRVEAVKPLEDDGEFVYCLPRKSPKALYNPYDLQVVTNIVGSIKEVELIPTLEWLSERKHYYLLRHFKIFSDFRMNKAFVTWKLNVKRVKTEKSRSFLYHHLFLADDLFQACLLYIRGLCEDAINLKNYNDHETNLSAICLVKLDSSRTYSLDEFCEEQLQQATQALKQLEDIRDKAVSEMKTLLVSFIVLHVCTMVVIIFSLLVLRLS